MSNWMSKRISDQVTNWTNSPTQITRDRTLSLIFVFFLNNNFRVLIIPYLEKDILANASLLPITINNDVLDSLSFYTSWCYETDAELLAPSMRFDIFDNLHYILECVLIKVVQFKSSCIHSIRMFVTLYAFFVTKFKFVSRDCVAFTCALYHLYHLTTP